MEPAYPSRFVETNDPLVRCQAYPNGNRMLAGDGARTGKIVPEDDASPTTASGKGESDEGPMNCRKGRIAVLRNCIEEKQIRSVLHSFTDSHY
jgi:hypothetical protein